MTTHIPTRKEMSTLITLIDIETEATSIDAVICTVGAVIFDPFTGDIKAEFYQRCDTQSQIHAFERVIDRDTQTWWQEQQVSCPEAYSEAFNPDLDRHELQDTLTQLNTFIKTHSNGVPQVMGNGPEFDNAIILHAMNYFGISPCWNHQGNQSLRTVVMMGQMLLDIDPKYDITFEGQKHHALDDCKHEAKYMHAIFNAFNTRLSDNK